MTEIQFLEEQQGVTCNTSEMRPTTLAPPSPGHPAHAVEDHMVDHVNRALNSSIKELNDLSLQIEELKDELIRRATLMTEVLAEHFAIAAEASCFGAQVKNRLEELRNGQAASRQQKAPRSGGGVYVGVGTQTEGVASGEA